LVLSLAACSATGIPGITPYKINVQQGNVVTQDMLAKLKPGMTRSQVRYVMGTPMIEDSFHPDRWDYVYTFSKHGGKPNERRVTVVFKNDRLAHIEGDVVAQKKSAADNETPAAAAAEAAAPDAGTAAAPTPVPESTPLPAPESASSAAEGTSSVSKGVSSSSVPAANITPAPAATGLPATPGTGLSSSVPAGLKPAMAPPATTGTATDAQTPYPHAVIPGAADNPPAAQ
jgi:outer membrane protein assembly factor BamE